MNIFEEAITQVITQRRTIRELVAKDKGVPLEDIYDLLEKASYAPYHSSQAPWEVILIHTTEERDIFAKAIANSIQRKASLKADADPIKIEKLKQKKQEYLQNVPATLIVTMPICDDQKKQLEAVCAVSAFIQNFQLLAWSKEIGVTWRTPGAIFDTSFTDSLGNLDTRQIIGLLHLIPIDERTTIPCVTKPSFEQWTSTLSNHLNKE